MEKTVKLFDDWNDEKKWTDFYGKRKLVEIWEIWICKIWVNIGSEISKDDKFQRPVLVVSNYLGWDLVGILPMSTQYNEKFAQFILPFDVWTQYWLNKPTNLILNQFKILSSKRLVKLVNNIMVKGQKIQKVPHLLVEEILTKVFKVIQKKSTL